MRTAPPGASPPASVGFPGALFRWWIPLVTLAGVAVAAVLYFHRPSGQFFFPRCTFHQLTGLLCPGCGGLRALHELLHGHLVAAARSNVLVFAVPLGAVGWWTWCRRRGRHTHLTSRAVWLLFAALVLFTLVRNLPGLPARWLAP